MEAQRLDLSGFASDLNPVAVLITRMLCELLPRVAGHEAVVGTTQALFDGGSPFAGFAADVQHYAERVRDQVHAEISDYYPTEHRESAYHVLIDRTGRTELVPRLSLSIGVVSSDLCQDLKYLELKEVAQDVLHKAKSENKSASYTNRRRLVSGQLRTKIKANA